MEWTKRGPEAFYAAVFYRLGAVDGTRDGNDKIQALVYFSFTRLTTSGYGDIVPVDSLARSNASLEAVIGQLFPATLLARLITLELESRRV